MSIVPTIIISQVVHGQAKAEYDGESLDWATAAYKGDGYYGYTDGLHTFSYKLTNFEGQFNIQASLATNPTEDDWFGATEYVGNESEPFNGSGFMNVTGNFVWLRINITNFTAGTIDRVLYN
jgi:hypothetical protein